MGQKPSIDARSEARRLLKFQDITLNQDTYEVWRSGQKIKLTMGCFRLLQLLMTQPGRIHTRQELHDTIRNGRIKERRSLRSVDEHIHRLRSALGPTDFIHAVLHVGYAIGDYMPARPEGRAGKQSSARKMAPEA